MNCETTQRTRKPSRKRVDRRAQASDGSWMPVPTDSDSGDMELQPEDVKKTHNANLTEEEMRLILQARAKAAAKSKNHKDVEEANT